MNTYKVHVFHYNQYRAYENDKALQRARNCPVKGTWTLEELRQKNAAFRPLSEESLVPNLEVRLYHPDQGLYAVILEVNPE